MTGNRIETSGQVIGIESDVAVVEVGPRATGCGRCHEPGGCGGGLLNLQEGTRARQFRLKNDIGARVGDQVLICAPDGSILISALLSYGLPLAMLILFSGLATWRFGSDGAALTGGLLGLAIGLLLLRIVSSKREPALALRFKSTDYSPPENMCIERNSTT